MRLTKKETSDYIHNKFEKIRKEMKDIPCACEAMAYIETNEQDELRYEKLGQLEDIEDELGVDLLVFLKALKHGVFYKEFGDNKIRHTNNLRMSCFDGKRFCLANKEHYFLMEDYGKTKYNPWALTKEELL